MILLSLLLLAGVPADTVRYQVGDDVRWSEPAWDDSEWKRAFIRDVPDAPAILWIRLDIDTGLDTEAVETLGIGTAGLVAREVYWDGVLIGQAGRVGTDALSEHVGPLDALHRIPDSLSMPGRHVVALRMSSFHRPAGTSDLRLEVEVGDYTALSAEPFRAVGLPLVFLGAFVLVALYYLALFAADRRRLPYLLTALLCIAVAALLLAEGWRHFAVYPYDWHAVRLRTIEALTCIVGFLLVGTFTSQFEVPKQAVILASTAAGVLAPVVFLSDHETGTFAAFTWALVFAAGVTAWAVWQEAAGARWAFGGVLTCLVTLGITQLDFMEGLFFPAFGVLLAGLLTSLGLQTREARRQHEHALASAARLEAELLKKQLQPHFLMNTLTSIMEWVETDPQTGARALEAAAGELRTLSEVSGESLIPMRRELALCRAHLDVMGLRRGISFTLDDAGVNPETPIPPAVLHTLVENAVTHNAYPPGSVVFTLREIVTGTSRMLTLRTPLAGTRRRTRAEGGGLRYVRARLEESTPGRWSLSAGKKNGEWVTSITWITS